MTKLILATVVALAATASADPRPDVKQLAAARIAAAAAGVELARKHYEAGTVTLDTVYGWSLRVLDAQLDGARGKAIKDALQAHDDAMHELDDVVKKRVTAGIASSLDAAATAYFAVEADLWLARGKR